MKKILFLLALALCLQAAVSVKSPSVKEGLALQEVKRYKEALQVFSTLCKQRNARACFSLALMYENAQGVKRDDKEARKHYDRACKGQISSACFNLGLNFERNKLSKEADMAFYRACALNHLDSCVILAAKYKKKQKGDLAVEFFNKSCKLKDARSCLELARLYEDGKITRQNTKLAMSAYSTACSLGQPEACFYLGERNEGKDDNLAKRYYGRACDTSYARACDAYKRLNKELD